MVRNIILSKLSAVLEFAPDHFVDDADVGLDDFYYFGAYVFVNVVGDGDSVLAVTAKFNGSIYSLEQRFFVNTGYDKVALVDSLRTLSRCTDADSREGMTY